MSSKEVSYPAMDEEEEITPGQLHGGEQTTKDKKKRHEKEKKDDKTK